MAIEKMLLVDISAHFKDIDRVLRRCAYSRAFHPEQASTLEEYSSFVAGTVFHNPYEELHAKAMDIMAKYSLSVDFVDPGYHKTDISPIRSYISAFGEKLDEIAAKRDELTNRIGEHTQALEFLKHLSRVDLDFDKLFACKFLQIRFGRLPNDSMQKLGFYENRPFMFFSCDEDAHYNWCVYITTNYDSPEVDAIFNSLYFERIQVPDYFHETPEKAIANVESLLAKEKDELAAIEKDLADYLSSEHGSVCIFFSKIQFLYNAYEMRKFAVVSKSTLVLMGHVPTEEELESDDFSHSSVVVAKRDFFHIIGFIPRRFEKEFRAIFDDIRDCTVNIFPPDSDKRLKPPIMLKNNWLVRPFEMFVTMYGLPSYNEIDPTPYVGFTYTLLFGIMFGDLGQGLALVLIGFLLWKFKKMTLGRVISRIGVSSAIFGTVYGSVFGFEHLLDPLFKNVFGLAEKPIDVLGGGLTNTILIAAVGLGAVIILTCMAINIALGVKQRNVERTLFSTNGVAGFVFYGSLLFMAVMRFAFGVNLLKPAFILPLIILPLLVILMRVPISRFMERKRDLFHGESAGSYIMENVFELIETLLSFATNTISFLRVGGFVLSHAGMMAVVFAISDMVGKTGSPAVIIVGNLFVMGMEGLIVGIQVLRLEFYEIFSRFFEGGGEEYHPVAVSEMA